MASGLYAGGPAMAAQLLTQSFRLFEMKKLFSQAVQSEPIQAKSGAPVDLHVSGKGVIINDEA